MGYKVTQKGSDILEVLRLFEVDTDPESEMYYQAVELEYERIKAGYSLIEHSLPDVLANMIAGGLLEYEPD